MTDGRRCITPGGIQFTGLTAAEVMPGKRIGHALAILEIGARHRRQILHGDMSRNLTGADSLLHGFGKLFHQSQPARHPAHATIEAARQIIQTVAETLFQFLKQPSFFKRRVAFAQAHRALQHQRVAFAHSPDRRFHGVVTQLLQRRHALVTVDHQITIWIAGNDDDHDGRLLARRGQRSQQPPASIGTTHAQMLITAVELVKFQLHGVLSLRQATLEQIGSGIAWPRREVCPQALKLQRHKP